MSNVNDQFLLMIHSNILDEFRLIVSGWSEVMQEKMKYQEEERCIIISFSGEKSLPDLIESCGFESCDGESFITDDRFYNVLNKLKENFK